MEVLHAVKTLRRDAFGTRIREHIADKADGDIHLPQVYTALKRLEGLGMLVSNLDRKASSGRRGRTRRLYQLSAPALRLMAATSVLHDAKELAHEAPLGTAQSA